MPRWSCSEAGRATIRTRTTSGNIFLDTRPGSRRSATPCRATLALQSGRLDHVGVQQRACTTTSLCSTLSLELHCYCSVAPIHPTPSVHRSTTFIVIECNCGTEPDFRLNQHVGVSYVAPHVVCSWKNDQ